MTKTLRIYYPDGAYGYSNWMPNVRPTYDIETADILGLSGGSDVSPARYGKAYHPTTYDAPERDRVEFAAVERARERGIPIIGTCRGHQLLTVAAGGKLVQDMTHPGTHEVQTEDGRRLIINSLHHQMSHPWDMPTDEYRVIAWANNLSPYHYGETDADEMVTDIVPGNREVEIIYLPRLRGLGIQCHPEAMLYSYDTSARVRESIDYMRDLFNRLIAGTL